MSLLVTATLACALAALSGGIALTRRNPPTPSEGPLPEATATPKTPIGRLKRTIDAGDWQKALPGLLIVGGILGIMLFGSRALIFVFDQERSGWPMLALGGLTIAWTTREYLRA